MSANHCENCGCRVYSLGCVHCDEANYIEDQEYRTSLPPVYEPSTGDRPRKFADAVPPLSSSGRSE